MLRRYVSLKRGSAIPSNLVALRYFKNLATFTIMFEAETNFASDYITLRNIPYKTSVNFNNDA